MSIPYVWKNKQDFDRGHRHDVRFDGLVRFITRLLQLMQQNLRGPCLRFVLGSVLHMVQLMCSRFFQLRVILAAGPSVVKTHVY
jgi:hypothetical protein